jgi:hypothetical protein
VRSLIAAGVQRRCVEGVQFALAHDDLAGDDGDNLQTA